jgi:hypothetical protein
MRKHTTLILLLLIIIPVSGFSLWKETPEDVLIKPLKTFYSNNPNKTYNYISKADQNTISREEFIKQNNLDDPFRQEMAKITSSLNKYEINGTEINEDSAVVDIKITKPNMSKVFAEIFGPFHGPKNMKDPQAAARHMLRQYLKKADVPMVEERGNFTLVKEEDKWKVLLDPENNKQ